MPVFKQSPNPLTVSVALGQSILKTIENFDVSRKDEASFAFFPIARDLMKHPGVMNVLIARDIDGNDYLSVRKSHRAWTPEETKWVMDVVDYYAKGKHTMVMEEAIIQSGKRADEFVPQTLSEKAVSSIFTQVMLPVVKGHGGSFKIFRVVENPDKTVDAEISLQGACSGCPQSKIATLAVTKVQLRKAFRTLEEQNEGRSFGQIIVFDPSDLKTPQFKI